MYTTPAQWAVDPMLPGACACSGILLLAVILIIACMAVVRRKSAKHTGLRWLAITLLAIVSLVWLALAIDQFMFEPRFDDTYAFAAVSDLPEVKAYLDDGAARGIDREVVILELARLTPQDMPTVAKDQTIPRYYVQCVVGDRLPGDDHLHNPWHVFLVELMHGKISILVNHTWMPLETWRQFPTSSRP